MFNLLKSVNKFGPDIFPGFMLSPHEQYVAYTGHSASFVPSSNVSIAAKISKYFRGKIVQKQIESKSLNDYSAKKST